MLKDWCVVKCSNFEPIEWKLNHRRPKNACFCKLVCDKKDSNKVLGFHYLGPNAGNITQGFAGMIKMGATKRDFDYLIGIHPTTAEHFTTMDYTDTDALSCSMWD